MNKFNFSSLLLEKQNNYTGSKISLIFLIVWATIGIVRGSIHIFAPDGGAGSIAGFDLSLSGAADLIFIFAALGVSQLIFTAFQWFVIFRYQAFIPFTLGLLFLSETLGLYAHFFKPISNTPPGQIGGYIMIPVSLVMFMLSLIQTESQSEC